MTTDELIQLMESKELVSYLYPFKVIFIIASLLLLYAIIYYYIKEGTIFNDVKRRTKDFLSFQRYTPPQSFLSRCKEISSLLEEGDIQRGVLKMEELFHQLLKRFGYVGETLKEMVNDSTVPDGENLKKLAELADELRKDKNYPINKKELQKLFDSFEDTLRKFGVLEEVED
jgi:hypothetical protein